MSALATGLIAGDELGVYLAASARPYGHVAQHLEAPGDMVGKTLGETGPVRLFSFALGAKTRHCDA